MEFPGALVTTFVPPRGEAAVAEIETEDRFETCPRNARCLLPVSRELHGPTERPAVGI